ncbi:putative membrane protein [Buttiauxella brennerae ATCC 51605]|uniref:Putative membrane protein n=1 Tax=Buttiauxella brennerae ATCC 51605 TaxID=1354251 RepID=A0A1B7IJP7_9ENTR|nr:DUF898 family protein [Buttiauxella brennerae]OAT29704.1 putative membrane protein [Buttiauxella brennerae ATCC 51605]
MSDQQVEIKEKQSRNLVFNGTGSGYFRVCIVNLLLIIITFGLFSAWALVRSKRYLYSHTELSGSRFGYHATGRSLFASWLCMFIYIIALEGGVIGRHTLVAVCLGAVLILFMPYLLVQSLRYQLQSTTLNNVRFNFRCSGFKAWWVMLGCPLIMMLGVIVVCTLIMATCRSVSVFELDRLIITGVIAFVVGVLGMAIVQGVSAALWLNLLFNHLSFGKNNFSANISIKKFVTISLISTLILIPVLLIVLKLEVPAYIAILSHEGDPEAIATILESSGTTMLVGYLIYMFGILLVASFLYVTMRNYYYKTVSFSEKFTFRSTLTITGFFSQLIINTLITACTLGLGYPWARVRYCRYLAQNTWVDGDLDELDLQDHNEKIANDIVSRLSRGLAPNISF